MSGTQGIKFTILMAGIVAAVLLLAYHLWPPIPNGIYDSMRWKAAVVREIAVLDHLGEVEDLSYTVGDMFSENSVYLSVDLICDSNDPETNIQLVDDAGRAIAIATRDYPTMRGHVSISVDVQPADKSTWYNLDDVDPELPQSSFQELADYYGIK